MRSRALRRHNDRKKALRKQKLASEIYYSLDEDWEYYHNLHQYSKNKIHCSCPMCSFKTNNRGRHKWYGKGCKNWKHSDLIKVERLNSQLVTEI